MTVLLELLTVLFDYFNLFNGIVQSTDFRPQISSIISDSLLYLKLCWLMCCDVSKISQTTCTIGVLDAHAYYYICDRICD